MTILETFLVHRNTLKCETIQECLDTIQKDSLADVCCRVEHRIPIPKDRTVSTFTFELSRTNTCLPRCDMIDSLECSVPFSLFIGETQYTIPRILQLCLVYHPIHIHIDLSQPNLPDELVVSYMCHFFSEPLRRNLIKSMNPNGIFDGEIGYAYGMAGRTPEWRKELSKQLTSK